MHERQGRETARHSSLRMRQLWIGCTMDGTPRTTDWGKQGRRRRVSQRMAVAEGSQSPSSSTAWDWLRKDWQWTGWDVLGWVVRGYWWSSPVVAARACVCPRRRRLGLALARLQCRRLSPRLSRHPQPQSRSASGGKNKTCAGAESLQAPTGRFLSHAVICQIWQAGSCKWQFPSGAISDRPGDALTWWQAATDNHNNR